MSTAEIYFPEYMRARRDWLVRQPGKRSESALADKPAEHVPVYKRTDDGTGGDYNLVGDEYVKSEPGQGEYYLTYWRLNWDQQCIGAAFKTASALIRIRPKKYEGLTFRLHTFDSLAVQLWLVCLDFDTAFAPDGILSQEVQDAIALLELFGDVFIEYSRSGTGLHVFVLTRCAPFDNRNGVRVNSHCKADVLIRNAVAVTGRVWNGRKAISEVPFYVLEALPFFNAAPSSAHVKLNFNAEWWSKAEEPLPERLEYLRLIMKNWAPAVKDHGREKTTFAAACALVRAGVVGWTAVRLLELCDIQPEYDESQLQHKVEGAYLKVQEEKKQRGQEF